MHVQDDNPGEHIKWIYSSIAHTDAACNMQAMKSVCFLFNHDTPHQVAHMAGIAAALAERYPDIKSAAMVSDENIRQALARNVAPTALKKLEIAPMKFPRWLDSLITPLNRLMPARRFLRLHWNAPYLRTFDAIISTERTCLTLKKRWREDGPKFIHVPHGAGDRNVTHHPEKKLFDHFLLSGLKMRDQMVRHNIARPEDCSIIGYPKFDSIGLRPKKRFFQNDNPVFLYNPHFDPALSSWYNHGVDILDWFYANSDRYNLIFAPHIMLFFKKTHISLEYKVSRQRPDIPSKYLNSSNILIDTDSKNLFDMSYTLSADAYIGDVSSQIYEFLYSPRPCFFVDVRHHKDTKSKEETYDSWTCGPVASNMTELAPYLLDWRAVGQQYLDRQTRLINYMTDRTNPNSAAARGADAVAKYLGISLHQ